MTFEAHSAVALRDATPAPGPASYSQLMRNAFSFPDIVDERAARTVATAVVLVAAGAIVFDQRWLMIVLAYGFIARVLAGPTFSPLALLATKVIVPRLPFCERPSPGPAKRFAQGMGVVMSLTAVVLAYGFGLDGAAHVVLGVLIFAAGLEAAFGLCLGCKVFALLMRLGVIPPETCEACANIWAGRPPPEPAAHP